MTAVPIRALHPYEVCIAPGLLSDLGPRAAALLPPAGPCWCPMTGFTPSTAPPPRCL
ncbi:MAG: hypothetical protein ACLUNQ_08410 [Oscillospiraceae bacterium]